MPYRSYISMKTSNPSLLAVFGSSKEKRFILFIIISGDKNICISMKQELEDNQHVLCTDFNLITVQLAVVHLLLEEQMSILVAHKQAVAIILEHI